jgi:predicted aconitase with swiveling domain
MTEARGSSSSSSALVEAARQGTAPAAIFLARIDPILVIGSLVAADLYGIEIPILLVDARQWGCLRNGAHSEIDAMTLTGDIVFGRETSA